MIDDGFTVEQYWAQLRAKGIRNPQRVHTDSYIATTRSGAPVQIPDPTQFSPVERRELVALLRLRHEEFDA